MRRFGASSRPASGPEYNTRALAKSNSKPAESKMAPRVQSRAAQLGMAIEIPHLVVSHDKFGTCDIGGPTLF